MYWSCTDLSSCLLFWAAFGIFDIHCWTAGSSKHESSWWKAGHTKTHLQTYHCSRPRPLAVLQSMIVQDYTGSPSPIAQEQEETPSDPRVQVLRQQIAEGLVFLVRCMRARRPTINNWMDTVCKMKGEYSKMSKIEWNKPCWDFNTITNVNNIHALWGGAGYESQLIFHSVPFTRYSRVLRPLV